MNASTRKGTKSVIVSRRKFLIQLLLTMSLLQCASALSDNTCPNQMSNTVVYEGSSPVLPKVITDGTSVQWQVSSPLQGDNSLQDLTNYDDTITAPFVTTPPSYTADKSGLTITKATVEPSGSTTFVTAGLYIQTYKTPDCSTGAGLAVIRSGPTCTLDASNPNDVKLNCSVTYESYVQQQMNPIMTWTNSNGAQVLQDKPERIGLSTENLGLQNATSQYSVASGDVQTYGCTLTFYLMDPARQPPIIATNAPSFTASCSVNNVLVITIAPTAAPTTMVAQTTTPSPSLTTATVGAPSNPPSTAPIAPNSPTATVAPNAPTATIAPNAPVTNAPPASNPSNLASSTSTPGAPLVGTSTSPSGQSPLTSASATSGTPAKTTTTTSGNNDDAARTLSLSLGLALGSFAVGAALCGCWCIGCCKTPAAAKITPQPPQRRRYYQAPYQSPYQSPNFFPRWYPATQDPEYRDMR